MLKNMRVYAMIVRRMKCEAVQWPWWVDFSIVQPNGKEKELVWLEQKIKVFVDISLGKIPIVMMYTSAETNFGTCPIFSIQTHKVIVKTTHNHSEPLFRLSIFLEIREGRRDFLLFESRLYIDGKFFESMSSCWVYETIGTTKSLNSNFLMKILNPRLLCHANTAKSTEHLSGIVQSVFCTENVLAQRQNVQVRGLNQ